MKINNPIDDHDLLNNVSVNDHHARDHALNSASLHTGEISNTQHGERSQGSAHAHANLSDIGASDHHAPETVVLALVGNGNLVSTSITNIANGMTPVIVFTDGASEEWQCSFIVPRGMTSISSMAVFFLSDSTGNVFLELRTAHLLLGDSVVRETDTTEAAAAFSGGTSGDIEGITVPAGAFNGLGSIQEGDIINLGMQRQGASGSDTYNQSWRVVGARCIFA